MKGKTLTKVYTERSMDHLDSTSDQHQKDQVEFRNVRQSRVAMNWMEDASDSYLLSSKFHSLGKGIIYSLSSKKEVTNDEFKAEIKSALATRNFYWLHYVEKKTGKRKRRRIKGTKKHPLRPIHQLAVTFRPDHSLALHEIDKYASDEKSIDQLRKFIKIAAYSCAICLREETGYEPLSVAVHPDEGCLHFHIIYATISPENQLLHSNRLNPDGTNKRGNPDIRLAGPCQVGLERARRNGIPILNETLHLNLLRDKIRDGEIPVDIKMSQVVDGCMEAYQLANPHHKPVFEKCFEMWDQAKSGKWNSEYKNKASYLEKIANEKLTVDGIEIL